MPKIKRLKATTATPIEYVPPFENNNLGQFDIGRLRITWCMREQFRDKMEDRLSIAENDTHVILGVFDGHGGYELAQYCAKTVCKSVAERGFDDIQEILNVSDDPLTIIPRSSTIHSVSPYTNCV